MAQIVTTGTIVQTSGIYRCPKCHNEITCVKGSCCPPCVVCGGTRFVLVRAAK